ncbi:MAG: hypothetical protein ACLP0B_21285 [Steroidobacteraceae bacterium]
MPRIEKMLVGWQSWAPERAAYIRCFDAVAAPAAFPEILEVSGLEPGEQVFVIYNVDDGLPMKLRGRLVDAITDAAKLGFVVLRAEYADAERGA